MRPQDLPAPSRFMFWCLAPFLVPTLIAFPFFNEPRGVESWFVMIALELLGLFTLFGFYDHVRYNWCLRVVGGIVFLLYLAYLASTVMSGQWVGNGRGSGATSLNAFVGLVTFGYPGFMYAALGRFTWRPEPQFEFEDEASDEV